MDVASAPSLLPAALTPLWPLLETFPQHHDHPPSEGSLLHRQPLESGWYPTWSRTEYPEVDHEDRHSSPIDDLLDLSLVYLDCELDQGDKDRNGGKFIGSAHTGGDLPATPTSLGQLCRVRADLRCRTRPTPSPTPSSSSGSYFDSTKEPTKYSLFDTPPTYPSHHFVPVSRNLQSAATPLPSPVSSAARFTSLPPQSLSPPSPVHQYHDRLLTTSPPSRPAVEEDGIQELDTSKILDEVNGGWVSDGDEILTYQIELEPGCADILKIAFFDVDARWPDPASFLSGDVVFLAGVTYFVLIGDRGATFLVGRVGDEEKIGKILLEYAKDPDAFPWEDYEQPSRTELRRYAMEKECEDGCFRAGEVVDEVSDGEGYWGDVD
ncbi:hypothetical protein BJ508DRAFT_415752 [Ascobolus immersus RN42]|uniref:Uncharacterized protein n=1 Tax=Ascobolus immersus RN42 TaxID=1160509 RepID=A0A3N4I6M5_ASCIM|nr:hypothetical protein BJ508DRAFT_415752 [Ascobolus immersus RN42]